MNYCNSVSIFLFRLQVIKILHFAALDTHCESTWIDHDIMGIDHIRILGNGLELACNGASMLCGGISIKRNFCHFHLKSLPTLASIANLSSSQSREREKGILCKLSLVPK